MAHSPARGHDDKMVSEPEESCRRMVAHGGRGRSVAC